MKKMPHEVLTAQLRKYSLSGPDHFEHLSKYLDAIYEAMEYYAEHAVNEQREIMARHLNLRNVPRPKLNEDT
jgi:hypothetical protein